MQKRGEREIPISKRDKFVVISFTTKLQGTADWEQARSRVKCAIYELLLEYHPKNKN